MDLINPNILWPVINMTGLEEEFDFVDNKIDKGEMVRTRKPVKMYDESLLYYMEYSDFGLSNLRDGTYVIFNDDNYIMTVEEFIEEQLESDLVVIATIRAGKTSE
jgi:hypothetical protein